jgi:hypothetical protein
MRRARTHRHTQYFIRSLRFCNAPTGGSSLAKNDHVAVGTPDTSAVNAATDSTP